MGYLWRGIWAIVDAAYFVQDAFYPLFFIVASGVSGFAFGRLWQVLFGDPGDKELIVLKGGTDV